MVKTICCFYLVFLGTLTFSNIPPHPLAIALAPLRLKLSVQLSDTFSFRKTFIGLSVIYYWWILHLLKVRKVFKNDIAIYFILCFKLLYWNPNLIGNLLFILYIYWSLPVLPFVCHNFFLEFFWNFFLIDGMVLGGNMSLSFSEIYIFMKSYLWSKMSQKWGLQLFWKTSRGYANLTPRRHIQLFYQTRKTECWETVFVAGYFQ